VAYTSHTHPLQIASVAARNGLIGMTFCPGKKQRGSAFGVDWDRQLEADIAVLVAWQTKAVLTFNEAWELSHLGVPDLGDSLTAAGIQWHHLPIVDGGIPGSAFGRAWETISPQLHVRLDAEERIVLHCKGGLGRTGTLAARLLVEVGIAPQVAIDMVRRARPGAIENDLQETYVRRLGCSR